MASCVPEWGPHLNLRGTSLVFIYFACTAHNFYYGIVLTVIHQSITSSSGRFRPVFNALSHCTVALSPMFLVRFRT